MFLPEIRILIQNTGPGAGAASNAVSPAANQVSVSGGGPSTAMATIAVPAEG
ncbi:MAG TPA: hypothetical protein VGZ73_10725 [Bryobacteraceae bacterium]|nr:hypothetical protein [Bryobacteraceae bacterium]